MSNKLTIDEVNNLSTTEFQQFFKNVIESWPEAAAVVATSLPVTSLDDLLRKFEIYLETVDDNIKHTILCLHPDLAGRLLDEKRLTAESANEQALAGLDKLSSEQKKILVDANSEYMKKFGYPFVICVRENNKIDRILDGFNNRKGNDELTELNIGIGEVMKICAIRIRDIVQDQ